MLTTGAVTPPQELRPFLPCLGPHLQSGDKDCDPAGSCEVPVTLQTGNVPCRV